MGAGDPSAAQRRETESVRRRRERPQAHRIRTDALRDDDGRHPIQALQIASGYGGRSYSSSCQEGCPCCHLGIYPFQASAPKGIHHFFFFFFFVCFCLVRRATHSSLQLIPCQFYFVFSGVGEEAEATGPSHFHAGRVAHGIDPSARLERAATYPMSHGGQDR